MRKLIVVLMGGLSGEREISFLTGKACSKALRKKGYNVKEIDAKSNFVEKLKKLKPKLVFNALHGKYGEDGVAQSYFECLRIPYTHSGVISSYNAMNKIISKEKNLGDWSKIINHFSNDVKNSRRLIYEILSNKHKVV